MEKGFPEDTTKTIKTVVLKHEKEFVNMVDILHCKLPNNVTAAYVCLSTSRHHPFYHQDLRHTQVHKFYEFLKLRCCGTSMRQFDEVLSQYEI